MRAGVYTRISRDDLGDEAGTDRQLQDAQRYIAAKGYQFVAEYRENDTSASKGLPRPVYDRIIRDAIDKALDVIVVASVERLYREPRELEDLIDDVEQHGLLIENVGGMLNLSTKPGQMVARMFAATGKYESDMIGVRVKRQKQQRAEQGLPQGGKYRVLGYTRQWELIPDEVKIVEEIFNRRAAGESGTAVAKSLNARGLTTTSGNKWHSTSVSRIVTKPGYKGKRLYNGQIIGDTSYPSIISEALWDKANSDVAKRSGGFNTRRYVLTGLLLCGNCHRPMNGKPGLYRCDPKNDGCGNLSIKQQWAEASLLNEVYNAGEVSEPVDNTDAVEADIEALRAKSQAVRDKHISGDIDLEDMTVLLKGFKQQISDLKKTIVVTTPATNPAYNALDFAVLELDQKKIHIRKHVSHVVVKKATKIGRVFEPERLEIHWQDGHVSTPALDIPDLQTWIDAVNDRWGMQ